MANIQSGSKWFNRSRINVDSDLLFNGVDQTVYAENDTRHNFQANDFGVSFVYEAKSSLGVNTLFSINGTTNSGKFRIKGNTAAQKFQLNINPTSRLIIGEATYNFSGYNSAILDQKNHILVNRIDASIFFYLNGKELNLSSVTNQLLSTDEFNFEGSDLAIGSANKLGGTPTNISASNLIIFNRAATQGEISYISKVGGHAPPDMHEFIAAHYPLQSICKVDGSIFTPDAVEQYNYVKYKYLDITDPSTSDFDPPTNGATITGGVDSDGTYVQFDAGDPMVNSQILSFADFFGPLFAEPNTNGEKGRIMVTKLKFKIANGSNTILKITRDFIASSTISEAADGSNIKEIELRDNIPSEGGYRVLKLEYNLTNASPITSSVRIYGIEYYIERKKPLEANNAIPVNFTEDELGITSAAEAFKDFHNKQTLRSVGYSNKYTDADYSAATTYEFFKYDHGSIILTDASDWSLVITAKYLGNFGPNFGVGGARNSIFVTGRLALGQCMPSYEEGGSQKMMFDTGPTVYIMPLDELPVFSDTLNPAIFIISNDSAAQEITLTTAEGITGRRQSKTFDTSGDPAWNSDIDARIFSYRGQPVVTDVIISNDKITESMHDDIIDYNFDNITNKFLQWKFDKTATPTKLSDISGNGRDASLFIGDESPTLITDKKYLLLDLDSNMPILGKALFLKDEEDQYLQSLDNFQIPHDENGYYTINMVINPKQFWPASGENSFPIGFFSSSANAFVYIQLRDTDLTIAYDDPSEGQKTTNLGFSTEYLNEKGLLNLTILIDNSGTGFNNRFQPGGTSESTQLYIDGIFRPTSSSSSSAKIRWDLFDVARSRLGVSSFRSLSSITYNGYFISLDIWNRALSDKEILSIANNTLLKRPSIKSIQKNLQFSLDYQNPVYDSSVSDYVFKDKIYGHRFQQKNYNDLADIENNIIDICDLRDSNYTPITEVDVWVDELSQFITDEQGNLILVP